MTSPIKRNIKVPGAIFDYRPLTCMMTSDVKLNNYSMPYRGNSQFYRPRSCGRPDPLSPSSLRPWSIVNRVVLSTWGDSFACCPQMHEIVVYYRTYGHAVRVIHLSLLNIRTPYTVKIPLLHTAHDKKFDF